MRGQRFLEALEEEVQRDPDAFGLRPVMREAGGRLVSTLSDLRAGLDAFGPLPPEWAGSNADWFLYEFVRAAVGEGTGIVDALVRRSATRCAEKVLADPRAREAIEKEDSSGLAMDLFCLVYTFFFADVVTEFAKAAVSEQVKLALPGLVIIDPGGQIPDWVGEKVAGLIPNPCEQKHEQGDDGRSVSELAADVVWGQRRSSSRPGGRSHVMTETRRFEFSAEGGHQLGSGRQPLSDKDFRDTDNRLDKLLEFAGKAPDWAYDLLQIARAVYLVDKRFLRAHAADGWTRMIELAVQLIEPWRWTEEWLAELNALLGMLTSDRWTISVHGGAWHPQPGLDLGQAGEATLFSGGLDATAYAAHAATRRGDRLLLLAFDDVLQERQREIVASINRSASREISLRQVGQTVAGDPAGHALESSSRSRGFLYAASAVSAAAAHQLPEAAVPENGQLAVNPPLTPGRLGALSTRSVHPWTLALMNRIISGIGGNVRVTNPLLAHTKGEVCTLALDSGLDRHTLERTISCGNPRGKRFTGHDNCGYCFPCLVRRSGLLHAVGDDSTPYQYNLAELTAHKDTSRDLRALMRWLSTSFGLRDLIADSPFPAEIPPPSVLPVLRRGRGELAAMIEHLVPDNHPLRGLWTPVIESAA